jgi:hypothetical protein
LCFGARRTVAPVAKELRPFIVHWVLQADSPRTGIEEKPMSLSRRTVLLTFLAAAPALASGAQAAPLAPAIEGADAPPNLAEPAHHRRWHRGGRGRHLGWYKRNRGRHKGWKKGR